MIPNRNRFFQFNRKSALAVGAAAGFFCVFLSSFGYAQERAGGGVPDRYEVIDREEGERRLHAFRNQRLDGDYCFRFELEHLPHRDKKVTYYGTLWGSWNQFGPVIRIQLHPKVKGHPDVEMIEPVDLIIQNGPSPKAWLKGSGGDFNLLEGEALFAPVVSGVVYSPFDLQMPFIYWSDFEYEGPIRVQSRIAQGFLMQPPEASVAEKRGIGAVRVGLDDAYDALLRVQVLDKDGEERSRFTVESFKKVQGQYIVKEVTLKDCATSDRTRFRVKAASVGMLLEEAMFKHCESVEPSPISESMFEVL